MTSLPLLVIPSHLHFDHVGNVQEFEDVALADEPKLRAEVKDGTFTETPSQYMLERPYSFRVNRWLKDGEIVDLGGRSIRVIYTPGHTPDSLSLIDAPNRQMFTGDLVNRSVVLLNVPGSNVRDALHSVRRLLRVAPHGSFAYEAHSERQLTRDELRIIANGMDAILQGVAKPKPVCLGGVPALRYDAGIFPIVVPNSSDLRLSPLTSVTESLDFIDGKPCGQG